MATAKIAGGLYIGVDGQYHDANGKPIPDEVVQAVLGTVVPASPTEESTETPAPVLPEASTLKGKGKGG